MLSIGLMSGTSMDGIDCALIETDGTPNLIRFLGNISLSYPPEVTLLLKTAEFAVNLALGNLAHAKESFHHSFERYIALELGISGKENKAIQESCFNFFKGSYPFCLSGSLITLDEVINYSTYLHGVAVSKLLKETGLTTDHIDVVGFHGQALFHRPNEKISIIVGDGQLLADELGITVINDFRRRDILAGGQGAPFAPIYHQALAIRDQKIPLIVVNCGGIANITVINTPNESELIGFDTGPGNCLLDRFVRQRTRGKKQMDINGDYAKQGNINHQILNTLYEKSLIKDNRNYFSLPPPKSLDFRDIILIPELEKLSLEDGCATLAAFTAEMIVQSLDFLKPPIPQHWVLAGGGWQNMAIRTELENRLRTKLSRVTIQTADEAAWSGQAMEAQIFAYLAVRSLQNKPLSFPGTTGVPTPMTGGTSFFPARGPTAKVKELIQANSEKVIS